MKIHRFFVLPFLLLLMVSCGGNQFEKSPLDNLIRDMSKDDTFTILLHDMDVEGAFFKTYKHQYQVIVEKDGGPKEVMTDWMEVSPDFFRRNIDNMGMEIASKKDGKLTKEVSPPGFSNYVGNPQYGQWVQRDGGSFWEFYGKYAFMSSMFNMLTYPARFSYWNDYRTNYRGYGRSYYGPSSGGAGAFYGTNSRFNSSRSTSSRWSRNPSSSSFKSRVNSRVSRSPRSTSRSSTRSSRTSRSSSRYKSSGFRSRGGGFGK
ncbi:hypothetical protein [Xanthovirga aplysinae]|uniref:hypothetical protein n=1 Tax=Xanthovirga aplysinae TaxID=2529853 RepID=UPI0012BCBAB4|nr:hypothetical protein [Xanthovirga aplysinae]MTI32316.1 hypothetical protein [Xanthovirga aplysinae]